MTVVGESVPRGERSYALMAAVVAIASLPLAAGNLIAMLAAVHFNLNGMADPLVLLHSGAGVAGLWRWSMVLDVFGYYLPIIPVILLLRRSWHERAPSWVDLLAFCLLAYCLIGAIGGAELATTIPTLIRQYAISPDHRVALQTVFTGFTDGIYRGMWNLLEEFLAGVGWIGFGVMLRASARRLSFTTIALGVACLVDAAGTAINVDPVASAGLTVYLVLAPLWACWLGLLIIRRLDGGIYAQASGPDFPPTVLARPAPVYQGSVERGRA